MKDRLNRRGYIKTLFILALIVAIAFVAISFGRPYYRYYTLRSFTHDELLMDVGAANLVRRNVLKRADQLGIPLDDNNLEVTRNDIKKTVTVKAHWTEVVDFWGYYSKTLHFSIEEKY